MAMSVGPADGDDDGEVVSAINTTPLVDVMLVLLIIFLITIPVVTHTIPVKLPPETNQALQTKPQNIVIAVTKDGDYYWDQQKIPDIAALKEKLKGIANLVPQPEVHIRGDMNGRYEFVGRVVVAIQQSGIYKIAFITQPPPKGG
jgi:biopolymer transport protein ExbD